MAKDIEKEKVKQPVKTVLSNNWFFIKLMLKGSPWYLTFWALDAMRNQVSIFFEHTVGIGYVLEAAEYHYPFKTVAFWIILLAVCITLGMVFTVFVGDYINEKERPKVRQAVRMLLYEKAKDLDIECYDNPDFYNEEVLALSQIDNQIDRMVQFVQNMVSGVTVFISTGIYFLIKDKASIIFVVVSFVLSFALNQLFNKLSYKLSIEKNPFTRKRDYVKRVFYLNDFAKEIRLNPDVTGILMEHFKSANEDVYNTEKKYANKRFAIKFLSQHVSNNMFSDVFYISYLVFKAAVRKTLGFSTVAILYNSFGSLKRSLRIFTDVYPFACESSLYIQKIRNFLDYDSKIVSEKGLIPDQTPKEISIEDASFAYGSATEPLLKNITMNIKPHEKIALVGYNGAGKTTLVKLLMRLYDVRSGRITSNGVDIKDYDVKAYRNTIGTVFQDFHIFAGTIKENVLLDVADDADDEAIKKALYEAGLKKKLESLPLGLDTPLTTEFDENGVNLSGGESQKLAISRVFFQQAGLMILDEPSSALDPIAEYQLNHAMLEATKDKTVIFISHRLSTTRLADRIIMLENGRIVECGSHDELLKKNGKYAQMWKVQAGAYITV